MLEGLFLAGQHPRKRKRRWSRAVILCTAEQIAEHLAFQPSRPQAAPLEVGDPVPLDQLEEVHIRRVLARTKSLEEAAAVLGIDVANATSGGDGGSTASDKS